MRYYSSTLYSKAMHIVCSESTLLRAVARALVQLAVAAVVTYISVYAVRVAVFLIRKGSSIVCTKSCKYK